MIQSYDPRREILRLFHGLPFEQRHDFYQRMGRFPVGDGLSAIESLTQQLADEVYQVEWVPVDSLVPSPENDVIYGPIAHDDQMDNLIQTIRDRGIDDPLIVSADSFIISGHRRHYACCELGWDTVPVRRKTFSRIDQLEHWPRILAEYNPQRMKSAGALLRESLMKHADDPQRLLREHREASVRVDSEFVAVTGCKFVSEVSDKKQQFLNSVKSIVENMRPFWPLTVRQIHYQLLNSPPLITAPKRSKFDLEHYRYRNNKSSYDALVELLLQARYSGDVPMDSIDDPTRPKFPNNGFESVSHYVSQEISSFLTGYHRDRQRDQPRHIETLGEKGTLLGILNPICREYYVPLTLGRGYASLPVWRDMAARFRASGKDAMTLLVASDYDPEGLDLAKDAIRSLRDLWSIPVDYQRVAVNKDQIEHLGLAADFNPAKAESSRFDSFVRETGGEETWELEALPPNYLQDQVRAAIEANMDMDIYRQTIASEQREVVELAEIRRGIVGSIDA